MRRAPTLLRRVLLALLVLGLLWQAWYFAWVVWWRYFDPDMTAFMDHRLEQLREKNPEAALRHMWVPYDRLSVQLKRAVVAAEDDKFVDHEGFDWEGMQKAIEKNQRKGKVVAGGSTISQQLAKNLFLSASKTPWRSTNNTGPVSGRTPRQTAKASAACSTSMPRPSETRAPASSAWVMKGVSRP